MKTGNTPERIVNRSKGANFYCVECKKEYRKCKCRFYVSADTLHEKGHWPDQTGQITMASARDSGL